MDLAIHIILGLCLVVGALCIFLANILMKELNEVINKYDRKVENLQNNEQALREMILMVNQEKQNERQMKEVIMKKLIDQMREKHGINAVDDKPLDFPNDNK